VESITCSCLLCVVDDTGIIAVGEDPRTEQRDAADSLPTVPRQE